MAGRGFLEQEGGAPDGGGNKQDQVGFQTAHAASLRIGRTILHDCAGVSFTGRDRPRPKEAGVSVARLPLTVPAQLEG
jgi:hypothetical protein